MADKQRLGELLVQGNLITEESLRKALRLQVGGNRRLGYLLIKMGFISEAQLQNVLAKHLDLPMVNVGREFSPKVKKVFPRYLCHKYGVIPLSEADDNTLKVAMVDPSDQEAIADIEKYTGKVVAPVLASKSDVSASIDSLIPWSYQDIFNAKTSSQITAIVAMIAFVAICYTSFQFYSYKGMQQYGKMSSSKNSTIYENRELILGFNKTGEVSLLGHGAYSEGYYSITFQDLKELQQFLEQKKSEFSTQQLDWMKWVITRQK